MVIPYSSYSSVNKHLGYFGGFFLANVSNAARNVHVQIFVRVYVFISFGYVPQVRIVTLFAT